MDKQAPKQNVEKQCSSCDKRFCNLSNLRRHVRQHHPNKMEALAPMYYKNKNNFAYSCQKCNKNYNHKSDFYRHLKVHDVEKLSESQKACKPKPASKKCPLCAFCTSNEKEIAAHFEDRHEIVIKQEELEVNSLSEFEQWLERQQKKTQAKFVKKWTDNGKGHTKMYVCHRSGFYAPHGNGKRSLKIKGSVKIDGYCPAKIKLTRHENGTCKIRYVPTHVGHSPDSNLTYLYLTKGEKQNLAAKIAAKMPFDDILHEARNSIYDSERERIHLISRKDLYNIVRDFKLSSTSVPRSDDRDRLIDREKRVNKAKLCTKIKDIRTKNTQTNLLSLDSDLSDAQQLAACSEDDHIDESDIILQQPSSLNEEKEAILKQFSAYLNAIQSPTQLEIVKKVLAPLTPTLLAESSIENKEILLVLNELPVQRRLSSTTKRKTNTSSERVEITKMYAATNPDDEYSTKVERIIGENTDLSRDLENWMSKLPASLRSLPIIYLAIPGSHNSFTSDISSSNDVSLDSEKILHDLRWIICVKVVMTNWTKTQNLPVIEQLQAGIRYFDLRISTKRREDGLYFCHGLYSCKVAPVLKDIGTFLETHTEEVVILDCQHFYGFTQETHGTLMQMIIKTYGTKLLPYSDHMDHLSLDYMTSQFRYQLIVIYRSDAARFGQPLFWPSASFPTAWADTMEPNTLFNYLDEAIKVRTDHVGFVTQCILTPSLADVLANMFTTLKQKLAVDFEDLRTGWISKQIPGRRGVNVIIGDFIELADNLFTKAVINLNLKLLSDLPKPLNTVIGVNGLKRY